MTDLTRQQGSALYKSMKSLSKQPNERTLPELGRDYWRTRTKGFVKYKIIKGSSVDDFGTVVPWKIELVSFKEDAPKLYQYVNFAYMGNKRPISYCVWNLNKTGRGNPKSLESVVAGKDVSVIIHVISPNLSWEDTGKGQLNVSPFAGKFSKAFLSVVRASGRGGEGGSRSQVGMLREFLRKRHEEVMKNPEAKEKNKYTQSTVFYLTRRMFGTPINRKSFTKSIADECRNLFGVKRSELGIVAADRAQMFFGGRWTDVGLDDLEALAEKGTDILFVEKEGVAEVLAPQDKEGIALVNSRGFAVEYVQDLLRTAREKGANLANLTDCDASGILIAKKLAGIPRIGVTLETLSELDIEESAVVEDYQPVKNHMKALEKMQMRGDEDPLIDYVRAKRIEIDSVLAEVGPEKFWAYVLEKINAVHPTRDYTRALSIPPGSDMVSGRILKTLEPLLKDVVDIIERNKQTELDGRRSIGGYLNVGEEEEKIRAKLDEVIREHPVFVGLVRDLQKTRR